MSKLTLEPAAQAIADATSKAPFLDELRQAGAWTVLDDIQAAPIDKPEVDEKRTKRMAWFWDAYLPHWETRAEITASPLRGRPRRSSPHGRRRS